MKSTKLSEKEVKSLCKCLSYLVTGFSSISYVLSMISITFLRKTPNAFKVSVVSINLLNISATAFLTSICSIISFKTPELFFV